MTQHQPGRSATRYWLLSGGAVFAVLCVMALALATSEPTSRAASSERDQTAATSSPAAPSTRPAAPTAPEPAGIGPGVYIVGVDIQPGTYRTDGAAPRRYVAGYCMWSRHDNVGGGPFDGIIASDGNEEGQMVVTIEPGDKRFMTRGCQPWTPVTP